MKRNITPLILFLLTCLFAPACVPATPSKPNIILVAPPHGSQFREGDTIAIQLVSTDPTGIVRVEVLVDGAIVSTAPAPSPPARLYVTQNGA